MSDSTILDGFVLLDDTVTNSILDSNSDDLYSTVENAPVINNKIISNINNDTNDFLNEVDGLKGQDLNPIENIVECDSTIPISLEKVELDNEFNEIQTDDSKFLSYPITLIDSNMCNINESITETENRVFNNRENITETYIPDDNLNVILLKNALNEHDEYHENDIKFEDIYEQDGMTSTENHKPPSIVKSSNEMNTNLDLDKVDFRINILTRNDEENKWSTNQYIQKDSEENKFTPKEENSEVKDKENVENIEIDNSMKKLPTKREENDINMKNEKDDSWTTDQYLHDDKEETRLSQKDENINAYIDNKLQNEDQHDYRVNILERNDRVDTWLTNQHIDKETEDRKSISNIENEYNPISTTDNEFECDANKTLVDAKLKISDLLTDLMENVSNCPESPLIESDNKSGDKQDAETNENVPNLINNHIDNDKQLLNAENSIDEDNERELSNKMENLHIDQRNVETVSIECSDVIVSNTNESMTAIKIPPLIGVSNSRKFPAMIAVISVMFNCEKLRCGLIDYHHSDEIANFDIESSTDISLEDISFMNNLCKLFVEMKAYNERKIIESADLIRNYFRKKENQFDFFNGFNYFFKIINTITKSVACENENFKNTDDIMFDKFLCKNKGFASDSFCGQIKNKIFCNNCQKIYSEEYEQTYSLLLKLPLEMKALSLEDLIKSYFSNVKIEITNEHKCCNDPSIWANKEFTHTPDYLILCIDRNLENDRRNRTFIGTDTGIFINSKQGTVLYSLSSVVDEMVMNREAFNYVKCLYDFWYMIEAKRIRKIGEFELINEYNVGFLFKKIQD